MLDNLGERLQKTLDKFKGTGSINEDNIKEITREIRLVLLEADVSYLVVKEFIANVKEKAIGEEVKKSLNPGDVFVKIVKEELINLLGEKSDLIFDNKLTIAMLVGLQGSGKTTTAGKLANLVRKKYKKKPLLIAADVYRPAAREQLQSIGKELNVEVYTEDIKEPVIIAKNGVKYALDNGYDYVLIDTAGRLHIDEELMTELKNISSEVNPQEILLIIDSMVGQDGINVIKGFNESLKLTGSIVTKLDGDAKGGVTLSIRHLTNIPIKLVGVSEKLDGIDEFYPERMADRLIGMGDIVSLVEKVESEIDEKEAKKIANKMKQGKFDLEDFLSQIKQIKKLGPLESILKMLPGASKLGLNNISINPKEITRVEAIIQSMKPKERQNPNIIKAQEKIRIAKGSGTSVQEVNRLLKQFEEMKKMMKQMGSGNFKMPF